MSALADARRSFSDIISTTVTVATSGDNTLVAAVTSPNNRKIKVLAVAISAASAVNVKFTSSTTSDITKLFYLTSGDLNVVLPYNPFGWFQTVSGELLGLNLSGNVSVAIQLTYVLA